MIEINTTIHDSVIKETLNRIGIANEEKLCLFPSVYMYTTIIEGKEKKFLIHFKEYYQLTRGDTAYNNISKEDFERLGYIAGFLKRWGLIDCDSREIVNDFKSKVTILSKTDSKNWKIVHKIKL